MPVKNYTTIDNLLNQPKTVSYHPEAEPIITRQQEINIQEAVEYEPKEESKPTVTFHQETIELTQDLKSAGLQNVDSSKFPSYQSIKLPISDEKIIIGSKAPIYTSFRWFSELAKYILAIHHLILKVVKGKVFRVIKT